MTFRTILQVIVCIFLDSCGRRCSSMMLEGKAKTARIGKDRMRKNFSVAKPRDLMSVAFQILEDSYYIIEENMQCDQE